jgi:hypothetical protein
MGTPVKGGFPWQLWHRLRRRLSTSQNPPEPVAPPEPDPDDVVPLVVAPDDPPNPPCPAPELVDVPDPPVRVVDPDPTSSIVPVHPEIRITANPIDHRCCIASTVLKRGT